MAKDATAFERDASSFLEMLLDQDRLLATRQEFLLGKWIADARACATNAKDKDLLEQNARTLVTVWGPEAAAKDLHDYSNREWSGMLRSFHYPRWKLWVADQSNQLEGQDTAPIDWFQWENAWTHKRDSFPASSTGDSIGECRRVALKYHPLLDAMRETGARRKTENDY